MKKTILLTFVLLLSVLQGLWAQDLTISTVDEWNTFANAVSNGTTYAGDVVKLEADLTITTVAGSSTTKCFQGTFDGSGHTLTLNLTHTGGGNAFIAPFKYIKNATIKYLHTSGTITTNGKMAGGIVGDSYGTSTIQNCRSSVTINSSVSGDGTHGGLVGRVQDGTLTITDCLFDGSISGANTNSCGNGSTFCRYDSGSVDFSTCYYKTAYGTVQGTGVGSMSDEELLAALGPFWELTESGIVPIMDVKNLAIAEVGGVALEYDLTGDEIKPEPEVTSADGAVLVKDTHYTLTWSGNGTATGKYVLTITGKSPYCGTNTAIYTVVEPAKDYSNYVFSTSRDNDGEYYVIDGKEALNALAYKVINGVNGRRETYSGKRFKQTADIDMSYVTWRPIGNDYSGYYSFQGTYDGDGYFITNINHSVTGSYTLSGLFGDLEGKVKNVNLKDGNFGARTAGGIAGEVSESGSIQNCNVLDGTISSTVSSGVSGYIGGIAGELYRGKIDGCFTTASFARSEKSIGRGPVAGQGDVKGTITNSYYVNSPGGNGDGEKVTVYNITVGAGITLSGNFRSVGRTAANSYHFGKEGDAVTLSVTPPAGYAAKYFLNGELLDDNSFSMPAEDVEVTVFFAKLLGASQLSLTSGRKDHVTAWWGTYFDSNVSYTLGENAAAYTMGADHHLYRLGTDGRTIPAGTAVVIISKSANAILTPATVDSMDITDHAPGGNILQGSSEAVPVTGTTYVLGKEGDVVGFYRYNAAAVPAGKAYYVVNQ